MDLLCTENMNDYETELSTYQRNQYRQQQQQQQALQLQQQQEHVPLILNVTSPYSNSTSSTSSITSTLSSTSSSGYNSNTSKCSNSSSNSNSNSYQHVAENSNDATYNINADTVNTEESSTDSAQHEYYYEQTETPSQQQLKQSAAAAAAAVASHNAYINSHNNRALEYVNTATKDPIFLSDRCLENALRAEEKFPHAACAYFKTVQKDITPPMRKIVAEWMMEVCAEEKCQEEVVLLALNYMDRFLSTKSVRKTHLQILAAACLLLASKLREPSCRALSAELLVFYTDNSIYKGDLIKWELFVLSRLGWDLSSVTPLDFVELLLIRLPITECPDLTVDRVRQHAQAFISLAAKEHSFSIYSASTIAASSIAAALSGLNWHLRTGQKLPHLLDLLTDLTSVEQDYISECMIKMEEVFEEHSRKLQPYLVSTVEMQQQQLQHQQQQQQLQQQQQQEQQRVRTTSGQQQHQQQQQRQQTQHNNQMCNAAAGNVVVNHAGTNTVLPDLTQTCKMQANAQKDVQDIKF